MKKFKSKAKSQTTFSDAKVIKKIGVWTIEVFTNPIGKKQLVACNDWNTYYPIIYDFSKDVAWDHPYYVSANVRKWVRENSLDLYDLLKT